MNMFWKLSLLAIAFVVSMLLIGQTTTKLHFNRTSSSPYEAFLCIKGLQPSLGDIVSIAGHETEYFKGLHYTKRLVGLPGDSIEMLDGQVFVGGRSIGYLRSKTIDGNPLTPIHYETIPAGFVFVVGDHPHSFDSRYGEFGLVHESHIQGKCYGLWRRSEI